MPALKEQHRRFLESYMGESKGNGVEAARAAGYKGNRDTLASTASKLLARSDIRAAMKERVADDPTIVDRDERQRWWSRVMRGVDEKGRKVKIPISARIEASKLLGKTQGDFIEKREVKHTGEVVFYIPKNGREAPPEG